MLHSIMLSRRVTVIWFLTGLLTLSACSHQGSQSTQPTPGTALQPQPTEEKVNDSTIEASSPIQPTPTCYPLAQPTGEKVILATVEATPPAQVIPGQTVTVDFSGSYLIANNAIICGENEIAGYAYSDELTSNYNWDRQVSIKLNEQVLDTITCGYTCEIEVTIPDNLSPGIYQLVLSSYLEDITFDLAISDS